MIIFTTKEHLWLVAKIRVDRKEEASLIFISTTKGAPFFSLSTDGHE